MTETDDERRTREESEPTGLLRRMARLDDALDETRDDLHETLLREQATLTDNARLRALIKAQEFGSKHEAGPFCPWCSAGGDGGNSHDDCPAFTPDGAVR